MSLFSTRLRNTIQRGHTAVHGSPLKSAKPMMKMMLEMMVGVNGRPRVGAARAGTAPFDGSRPRRVGRSDWRPQARKLHAVRRSAAPTLLAAKDPAAEGSETGGAVSAAAAVAAAGQG
jgi:hypothetical protein